jgi:hypothetical protein
MIREAVVYMPNALHRSSKGKYHDLAAASVSQADCSTNRTDKRTL